MTDVQRIPDHMKWVVDFLRRAYPESIPADESSAVMALVRDAGMSIRSVAAAFGYYFDRPDTDFYQDANMAIVDSEKDPKKKAEILKKLRGSGYDDLQNQP